MVSPALRHAIRAAMTRTTPAPAPLPVASSPLRTVRPDLEHTPPVDRAREPRTVLADTHTSDHEGSTR